MIRNHQTLACALLGIVMTLFIQRGLDVYVLLFLALAVPWDKLAQMTEQLARQYLEWRELRREQKRVEEAWRQPAPCEEPVAR
jgi:hypothetical protein